MIAIRSPQINRSSFRTVEIRSSICYAPASVTERRYVRYLIPFSLLVMATILEASGDAIIRVGLRPQPISARIALMLAGAVILYGYGLMLNLAPLAWGRLVGAYVATFFVVGQIINLVAFGTPPNLPIVVGGLFIVSGGAIITLWQR
jgi:drug/metabolite transporter superfamily protein YnfA